MKFIRIRSTFATTSNATNTVPGLSKSIPVGRLHESIPLASHIKHGKIVQRIPSVSHEDHKFIIAHLLRIPGLLTKEKELAPTERTAQRRPVVFQFGNSQYFKPKIPPVAMLRDLPLLIIRPGHMLHLKLHGPRNRTQNFQDSVHGLRVNFRRINEIYFKSGQLRFKSGEKWVWVWRIFYVNV